MPCHTKKKKADGSKILLDADADADPDADADADASCSQGVALFGLQYLIGRAMGVDPLQTVIPLTLGEPGAGRCSTELID